MTVSLSGLDLSFLKKPARVKAGSFVFDPEKGKLVPASTKARQRARAALKKRGTVASPYFMPDVDSAYGGSWKSIIDGSEISSRPNWREHNKRNGVAQVDPDYWGKTDDHHVTQIRERMEFGAPTDSNDIEFNWKQPRIPEGGSAKERGNGRKSGGRGRNRKKSG